MSRVLVGNHTEAPLLREASLAIALPRILAGAGALPSTESKKPR
ncbi:MAG: hypothetical protein RL227_2146, partial [Pseudomonadota bacterium]